MALHGLECCTSAGSSRPLISLGTLSFHAKLNVRRSPHGGSATTDRYRAQWSSALTNIVGVCFSFPQHSAMFQVSLLRRSFVDVKQVVIGPHLRRAVIVIFDKCAGLSDFVTSSATGTDTRHSGARRLRMGLSLGAVRLHSQLHSMPSNRGSVRTGRRCATLRATRHCKAGRLSLRLLSQSQRHMPAVLN